MQCDIGLIYDEPRHALINKWLLLSNPSEASEGVKGFLKICAAVIGPNDDAPVHTAASRSGSGSIYIYIQLYSPECTLAENIGINNNEQNKDRNILINTVQLNIRYTFVNVLTKDITEDALGKHPPPSSSSSCSCSCPSCSSCSSSFSYLLRCRDDQKWIFAFTFAVIHAVYSHSFPFCRLPIDLQNFVNIC